MYMANRPPIAIIYIYDVCHSPIYAYMDDEYMINKYMIYVD